MSIDPERLLYFQAYDIRGEGKPAHSSTTSHACTSSQLVMPVCLVRQSSDLARTQHQQVGICRLSLEVWSCIRLRSMQISAQRIAESMLSLYSTSWSAWI